MNKNQIRIPDSHRPHFNIVRKIQDLQTKPTEFVLHQVYPVDIIGYLVSDEVSIRVVLDTEIDKELFEAWLDEQDPPDDFIVEYEIGRRMEDCMSWDKSFDIDEDEDYD